MLENNIIELISQKKLNFDQLKTHLQVEDQILRQSLDTLLKEGYLIAENEFFVYYQNLNYIRGNLKLIRRNKAVIDDQLIFLDERYNYFDGDLVLYNLKTKQVKVLAHHQKYLVLKFFKNHAKYTKFDYRAEFINPKKFKRDQSYICEIVTHNPLRLKFYQKLDKLSKHEEKYYAFINEQALLNFDTDQIVEELNQIDDKISDAEIKKRKDLRNLFTFTIDGVDSKDRDDAISIIKFSDYYKLFVHISDVSHYVKENSSLDQMALKRSFSIYCPNFVFPMFNPKLSNNICSLNPNVDRLTLTCEMDFDMKGEMKNYQIYPSIIHSDIAFDYQSLNNHYFKKENKRYVLYNSYIKDAVKLASLLEERSQQKHVINYLSEEIKYQFRKDKLVELQLVERNFFHKLIEHFMIAANVAVASYLYYLDLPSLYRVHPKMEFEKFSRNFEIFDNIGIKYSKTQNHLNLKYLSSLLAQADDEKTYMIMNNLLLRSNEKAKYQEDNIGHFALNQQYYTHFTSPIRRYNDLVIHRLLKSSFEGQYHNYPLESIADVMNQNELKILNIERKVEKYLKAVFMEKYLNFSFDAVVDSIMENGIYVKVDGIIDVFVAVLDNPNLKIINNRVYLDNQQLNYLDQVLIEIIRVSPSRLFIDGKILKVGDRFD